MIRLPGSWSWGCRFRSLRDIADFLVGFDRPGIEPNLVNLHDALRVCLLRQRQTVAGTYHAVLGRPPEKAGTDRAYRNASHAADHLVEALMCDELAENFFHLFCRNFPEARRILFVHIPKTAGSEFNSRLNQIGGQFITHPPAEPVERANLFLGFLYEQARQPHRPIIIAGHYSLARFDALGLIRPQDTCMTLLRDPRELVVSSLNYMLTVVIQYPERTDAKEFRALIRALGARPPRCIADVSPELIEALLFSTGFAGYVENVLLRYLALDPRTSQRLCLRSRFKCDIVPVEQIDAYTSERFGIAAGGAANSSQKFLAGFDELPDAWREHIAQRLVPADIAFYERLLDGRAGAPYRLYEAPK